MRSEIPPLPPGLRAAPLALIAALVWLGGCGSGHAAKPAPTSTPTGASVSAPLCPGGESACVSQSPNATVSGPPSLSNNLVAAMTRSQRQLHQVKIDCPRPAGYPVRCSLTATDASRRKPQPVAGTLTVMGIDTATKTYAYSLTYGPVRR